MRRLILQIMIFYAIAVIYANALHAQEKLPADELFNMSLEELLQVRVNVSSTNPETIFNTPSTVTVIDRDMLQRYNFHTIAEAIRIVAGMEVYQTIIDRDVATSRGILQNFYANKVLLMIDEIPTWQPIYGDGTLARISVEEVERIEVLKGPASVLYGSNAYSGVINIVLKEMNDNQAGGRIEAGVPEIVSNYGFVHFSKNDVNLTMMANGGSEQRNPYRTSSAHGFEYNGDSTFVLQEEYKNNNFTLKSSFRSHSLLFNHFNDEFTYFGAHPSYAGGGGNLVKNNGTLINYRYDRPLSSRLSLNSNILYDAFTRRFPLSADRVTQIHLAGDRLSASMKLNYDAGRHLKFELGAVLENRRSHGHDTRDAMMDTLIRHNLQRDDDVVEKSLFGQLNFTRSRLNILLGSRYTHNNNFGENISSRITGVLRLNPKNSIKIIWGQSFRVPTMFELYFDHPTVVGSKNLNPETSTSHEIAYLSGFDHFFFQILGFFGEYENLIQRVTPATGPPSQYTNVAAFEGYGGELELKYDKPGCGNCFVKYAVVSGGDESIDNNYR